MHRASIGLCLCAVAVLGIAGALANESPPSGIQSRVVTNTEPVRRVIEEKSGLSFLVFQSSQYMQVDAPAYDYSQVRPFHLLATGRDLARSIERFRLYLASLVLEKEVYPGAGPMVLIDPGRSRGPINA